MLSSAVFSPGSGAAAAIPVRHKGDRDNVCERDVA